LPVQAFSSIRNFGLEFKFRRSLLECLLPDYERHPIISTVQETRAFSDESPKIAVVG